ncbi:MAG: VOC family protein [Gemmatimonadota bacterium]
MSDAVRGISELVLIVGDVKRAAAFYRDTLGLEAEREVTEEWAWFRMGSPDRPQRIALRKGPLLFEEHSPHPPGQRWGPVHYALHVSREDVEQTIARVRGHAGDVWGPIRLQWMEADAYYFYDLDGNLLELWSPDPAA